MKKFGLFLLMVTLAAGGMTEPVMGATTPDWALNWLASLVPFHGMTYAIPEHPQVIITQEKNEPDAIIWRLTTTDWQKMPGQTAISLAHVAAPGAKPLGAMVTNPIAGMPSYHLPTAGGTHFYISCKDRHFITMHVATGAKYIPELAPFETLAESIFIEFVNQLGNSGELMPGK
ncbi:MAG: hypothetical protein LBH28_07935 [Oscillospiraceae bacterium]|jgi:hypothetical protein|nr:hypothetical protein [Oscillospiraceae bacterium]